MEMTAENCHMLQVDILTSLPRWCQANVYKDRERF